jgi:hypothetical protein
MSAAGFYRRVPLPVSRALALVAALALCPSDGRAACGDYVTVVGAASADTPGHPAPVCHGPGCSQAPTRAAPVPAPKVMERPTLDGVGTADPVPPPAAAASRANLVTTARSGRHPSDIFHPPRA